MLHVRLDVTVADPDAERYRHTTEKVAGAASRAEKGKVSKYGGIQRGVPVQGAGLEVTGRLGPTLCKLLRQLAGYARAERAAFGQEEGRFLAQWHMQLSVMLARYVAATIVDAYDTPPRGIARVGCTPAGPPGGLPACTAFRE